MEKADKKVFAVCEYENDSEFKDILVNPNQYVKILKGYQGFISPDCSIYRDMPLATQITNIFHVGERLVLHQEGRYHHPSVHHPGLVPELLRFRGRLLHHAG